MKSLQSGNVVTFRVGADLSSKVMSLTGHNNFLKDRMGSDIMRSFLISIERSKKILNIILPMTQSAVYSPFFL